MDDSALGLGDFVVKLISCLVRKNGENDDIRSVYIFSEKNYICQRVLKVNASSKYDMFMFNINGEWSFIVKKLSTKEMFVLNLTSLSMHRFLSYISQDSFILARIRNIAGTQISVFKLFQISDMSDMGNLSSLLLNVNFLRVLHWLLASKSLFLYENDYGRLKKRICSTKIDDIFLKSFSDVDPKGVLEKSLEHVNKALWLSPVYEFNHTEDSAKISFLGRARFYSLYHLKTVFGTSFEVVTPTVLGNPVDDVAAAKTELMHFILSSMDVDLIRKCAAYGASGPATYNTLIRDQIKESILQFTKYYNQNLRKKTSPTISAAKVTRFLSKTDFNSPDLDHIVGKTQKNSISIFLKLRLAAVYCMETQVSDAPAAGSPSGAMEGMVSHGETLVKVEGNNTAGLPNGVPVGTSEAPVDLLDGAQIDVRKRKRPECEESPADDIEMVAGKGEGRKLDKTIDKEAVVRRAVSDEVCQNNPIKTSSSVTNNKVDGIQNLTNKVNDNVTITDVSNKVNMKANVDNDIEKGAHTSTGSLQWHSQGQSIKRFQPTPVGGLETAIPNETAPFQSDSGQAIRGNSKNGQQISNQKLLNDDSIQKLMIDDSNQKLMNDEQNSNQKAHKSNQKSKNNATVIQFNSHTFDIQNLLPPVQSSPEAMEQVLDRPRLAEKLNIWISKRLSNVIETIQQDIDEKIKYLCHSPELFLIAAEANAISAKEVASFQQNILTSYFAHFNSHHPNRHLAGLGLISVDQIHAALQTTVKQLKKVTHEMNSMLLDTQKKQQELYRKHQQELLHLKSKLEKLALAKNLEIKRLSSSIENLQEENARLQKKRQGP